MITMPRLPSRKTWCTALLVGALFALIGTLPAAAQDDLLGGKVQQEPKTEAKNKAEVQRLQKEVAANPKNYRSHFQLANAYVEAGDEEKARDHYERALELNPKYIEAMVNLGTLFSDLNNYDEAIPYFESALKLNPDDCKARSNLGNAFYALERYPDAMYEYRRAVEVDPKCHTAMYNIAVAFADAGLFREAVIWWNKVAAVAPGTEAARSAKENIDILKPFTQPPPRKAGAAKGH